MTDEDFQKIRAMMRESLAEAIAPIEADLAEIKAVQAEQTRQIAHLDRSLAILQQDVTKLRNSQIGQEVILDDIQDQARKIATALDALRPPAVRPLGEGGIHEIRQLHSDVNRLQRQMAEFQARIEILEGRRNP